MIDNLQKLLKKNTEILALFLLILISIISTTYFNYSKEKVINNYISSINNVYFKKTINHFLNNLEPKYKKIYHNISSGETFNSILEGYNVKEKEINELKKVLSKKVNLNKLKTDQKIQFTLDQSNNFVKEFIFQTSTTEKIYLTKNIETNKFDQSILLTKLKKNVIYKENKISQSLYKAATTEKIPASVIIEFARIYGFQVDFQRDIRKNDKFQIMYETYIDDNKKIIETGNILFANLKLSGQDNTLYFFDKEGSVGHYDKNGKSVKKALMKTLINGARLSSPFGMRKHPIDGFNKMHKGTDFCTYGNTDYGIRRWCCEESKLVRRWWKLCCYKTQFNL